MRSLLIAFFGLVFAAVGLWVDGGREWSSIHEVLQELHLSNQPPALHCSDYLYWLSYAREMVDTGKMHIRETHLDNAPYGRPSVNWASLNAWYLIALARVWSMVLGIPVRDALLPASMWANPILYFCLLAGVLVVGWRARRFPAAALAVLILGTSPRLYSNFGYAAPSHHGWHDIATFCTVALMGIGIRRMDRRLFVLAGLAGGFALWIGATQQGFMLASLGLGAFAGLLFVGMESRIGALRTGSAPPQGSGDLLESSGECWRVFGIAGAAGSIVLYLVEFGFQPIQMHLEVNHPIYSAGFLLGGEFLSRFHRLMFLKSERRKGSDLPMLIVTLLALALIPCTLLFGPPEWHVMHQVLMQRLHNKIAEFQPLVTHYGFFRSLTFLGVPVLLTGCALVSLFRRNSSAADKIAFLACAVPCAVSIGMCFLQLRWTGSAGATAAAIIAVLFAHLRSGFRGVEEVSGNKNVPAAYLLVPIAFMGLWCVGEYKDNTKDVRGWVVEQLGDAEVADVLRSEARTMPTSPIVLFASQKERQAWIGYVTGIPGIGSLYWDNPDGVRDEAIIFASRDEATSRRMIRERGITHIVTSNQPGPVVSYDYLLNGTYNPPDIRQSLAYRLASPNPAPPSWLQLLPTQTRAMMASRLRIYRVMR